MSLDILRVRKALGRDVWRPPVQYGLDGWHMTSTNLAWWLTATVEQHEGVELIHVVLGGYDELPSTELLIDVHDAVFGDDPSYHMVLPESLRVKALHLFGRLDGEQGMPAITISGT